MHFVEGDHLQAWLSEGGRLERIVRGVGRRRAASSDRSLPIPPHLAFAMDRLVHADGDATVDALSSIPFYSLCKALFLPLSGMSEDKVAALFQIPSIPPPRAAARQELLATFLGAEIGLDLEQKLSCILGDPFRGGPATLKRDSLITLLLSVQLVGRRQLLDRLTVVGDVAVLFAESRPAPAHTPPLTAAEVLHTLRFVATPGVGRTAKFEILRSLLVRCGRLEAYFLAKLILKKAGFGFDYQGPLIARALADRFGATPEAVGHAMALTDAFRVAAVLAAQGAGGLQAIRLKPLVAVRPALASTAAPDAPRTYPVWVERKYDGIRFMLHKSTGQDGSVVCGAYTRNRRDWLELVSGLDATIRSIPARDVILDGELFGSIVTMDGARPASVYELYAVLQGEGRPLQTRFAAFDIVYLDGRDLTAMPFADRRRILQQILIPMQHYPLLVPVRIADGQMATGPEDVNRLYGHFRNQGYEGIITKDPAGTYVLARRAPDWIKRKPEITLDLVLLGAVFAVTEKTKAGVFGSYVIGARTPDGGFVDVGDVAGVDTVRDAQIQSEIMREGLITGQRIERKSISGVRPGIELRPHIVVTVKFEGIVRDNTTGDLALRDPKLVQIRSDKGAMEADLAKAIETVYLRQVHG